jgi:hypothetical protein
MTTKHKRFLEVDVRSGRVLRRSRQSTVAALVLGGALTAMSLSGCSTAKTEIACERAENLKEGVSEISRDVRTRDLNDARQEAGELMRDFDRLEARSGELSESNQSTIEPLLQPADDAIAALEAATTLDEMSAALDTGRAPIEALVAGVETTLNCDN